MSEWALKRFWKAADIQPAEGGFAIALDGRLVKTPAKAGLIVPTQDMAHAIAAEWDEQEDVIDPAAMPFTRSANAAIDKVRIQKDEVAALLADYGDADLLCYRAEKPQSLVDRQAASWDDALDWAADALGARLQPRIGVMHQAQDPAALGRLSDQVHALDPFQLAAFHDLVSLSGSLVLGFAATRDWRDPDTLWDMSRLDDLWQEEQWGRDEDAHDAAQIKRAAFIHAKTFYDMC